MQDDRVDNLPSEARTRGGAAKVTRDEMGFVTSEMPHFTLPQVRFLLALATWGDLSRASEESDATPELVAVWMEDEEFRTALHQFMENKRQGVKQIGQQVAPLMLLTLTNIIENGTHKDALGAIKLYAQIQGLLITRSTVVDASALETLRERLMTPRPIYKELPNGSS